ncbi:acyltransferase family-domain-containing protein [Dactylonectria macrodidyma]|uniref:Acyltransferase family-domain-containing protein n=1 Tax=Dactylonectria macrodidyma TaxID=307937 RepID=A0A9P9FTZ0_9HYPO|nr:acyltransferase family-domain-containing protein [Dactylonectria macrodidyma]
MMHGTSGSSPVEERAGRFLLEDPRTDVSPSFGSGSGSGSGSSSGSSSSTDDDFNPRQFLVQSADQILLRRLAWFLVPSFFQGPAAKDEAKLGPTAYLDGIRGVAAFALGLRRRLLYNGSAAVALFFAISGYALSYKPVKMIRNRSMRTGDFGAALSSMVFRRALRLYLPTVVSTGCIVIFLRLGLFEPTRAYAEDPTFFRHMTRPHFPRFDSGFGQCIDWVTNVGRSLDVFYSGHLGIGNAYDSVLWTIPIEYRSSLYLFLIYIGTSHLKTRFRIISLILIIFITYRQGRWDFLMFLCGLACVEWNYTCGVHADILAAALPQSEKGEAEGPRLPLRTIAWNLVSILALYLLSQPIYCLDETPGWVTLGSMIPEWWGDKIQHRYWQCLGAVLFTLSVSHSAFWQRIFTSNLAQYLGKISFSLYLVHSRFTRWWQFLLQRFIFLYITGVEGINYDYGFWLGTFFIVPGVICVADVFCRAVDIPLVRFSKWVEVKLVNKDV